MTSYATNPAYNCVVHADTKICIHYQCFITSIGVRILPDFEQAEFSSTDILSNTSSHTPPMYLKISNILYTLYNRSESTTRPLTFQSLFTEIKHTYCDHQPSYTDGSEDQVKVSAAMEAPLFATTTTGLSNHPSIFSAEMQ